MYTSLSTLLIIYSSDTSRTFVPEVHTFHEPRDGHHPGSINHLLLLLSRPPLLTSFSTTSVDVNPSRTVHVEVVVPVLCLPTVLFLPIDTPTSSPLSRRGRVGSCVRCRVYVHVPTCLPSTVLESRIGGPPFRRVEDPTRDVTRDFGSRESKESWWEMLEVKRAVSSGTGEWGERRSTNLLFAGV